MTHLWLCTILFALNLSGSAAPRDATAADSPLVGAEGRIDRIRKADVTILVVDRNGKPIPNVQVKIEQIRHDFLFGCAALSLLHHPDTGREETYQRRFGDLFNFATVLTYWHDTEPEQGMPNLDRLSAQVQR